MLLEQGKYEIVKKVRGKMTEKKKVPDDMMMGIGRDMIFYSPWGENISIRAVNGNFDLGPRYSHAQGETKFALDKC